MSTFDARSWLLFAVSSIVAITLYSMPMEAYSGINSTFVQLVRGALILFALYLLFEKLFKMELHTKILLGMVLGALAGWLFRESIVELKPVGTAFIRLIQMIVVPLVLSSLITGTASLGDINKMKRIGSKTLSYYLISTAFAITIGLVLANVLQPGAGLNPEVKADLLQNYSSMAGDKVASAQQNTVTPVETFLNMIPKNPFDALGNGRMLQIIFFAIFTGIALTLIPKEKARPVLAFFEGIDEVMIKIVTIAIELAPYGVFALIADAIGVFGIDILAVLAKYTLTVALGLLIMLILYPLIASRFSGVKLWQFLEDIRPAQLIAFSSSSSGATLPVTMEVAEEKVGVSNEISSFVLPLGATVNMDGTALYQGVATVFIAQVYGIPLDLGAQLTIVLTATLASIGTAAAPGVGMILLVMVLQQVGIPLEGIALILAVDRLLDMIRTTVNVTSDVTAATLIASSEKQLHRPEGA